MGAVSHENLHAFCVGCFRQLGLDQADAQIISDNLIFANLRGVDSHGVLRLKIYADRLRANGIDGRARPRVVSQEASSALIDAGNGMGQVASQQAMQMAIAKAGEAGVAVVVVKNSNHFGAAAFYALQALEHGMIGFTATNASPTMAPSGGREARLGNNPLAVAVPAGRQRPFVLDMASGAVARGKIMVARQEGKKIPTTWALDRNGVPTDDPEEAFHGLIQPLGGYKGYGLGLMLDLLTGVLSGAGFSNGVGMMYQDLDRPTNSAHTFAALRIDRFIALAEFRDRVDDIIERMRSCPRAAGVERIYVPGEIEDEVEQRRRAEGIPLGAALEQELKELAGELSMAVPF